MRIFAYLFLAACLFVAGRAQGAVCGVLTQTEALAQAGASIVYEYEGQARAACDSLAPWHEDVQGGWVVPISKDSCSANANPALGFVANGSNKGTRYDSNSACASDSISWSVTGSLTGWRWTKPGCPPGVAINSDGSCGVECSARPPLGPENYYPGEGTGNVCNGGCSFECSGMQAGGGEGLVIDGQQYGWCTPNWVATGDSCSVGEPPSIVPPTDSDGDGKSDSNDGSPNNPGSDGSGSGQDSSEACGGPDQPECAEDGSNSGSGKGNTSGGGGDCTSPPVSSGDAILAQIAFQTWATRCAISGNANEAGQGGTGTGPGAGDGDGEQPGWTKGNGPANPEDTSAQDIDDASDWGIGLSADLLNTENIFGNSSCPALPSFSIMGYEIDTSAFSWWCTLISIMRAAILIMGAFTAIQILLRGF